MTDRENELLQRVEEQTGEWGGRLFRERFEQALARLAGEDAFFVEKPVEIAWIKDLYPFHSDPEHPYIQTALRASHEAAGRPAEACALSAWGDAAHLSRRLGVPTAGMGSGEPGEAHSAGEYVVLDELVAGARSVALTMLRVMQAEKSPV